MAHLNGFFLSSSRCPALLVGGFPLLAPGGHQRSSGSTSYFLAAAAFVVSPAHPALLPSRSRCGRTARAYRTLASSGPWHLALAAHCGALLPSSRCRCRPSAVGSLLPGLAIGGVAMSPISLGVRSPLVWEGCSGRPHRLPGPRPDPRLMRVGGLCRNDRARGRLRPAHRDGPAFAASARAHPNADHQAAPRTRWEISTGLQGGTEEPGEGFAPAADRRRGDPLLRPVSGCSADSLTSTPDAIEEEEKKKTGHRCCLRCTEMRRKQPHRVDQEGDLRRGTGNA